MKRQPTEWEKVSVNERADEGLIFNRQKAQTAQFKKKKKSPQPNQKNGQNS